MIKFTPLHISNAYFVGGNDCKGNVTMRITHAQKCIIFSKYVIIYFEAII